MEFKKYVHRPTNIEAVTLTSSNCEEVTKWCGGDLSCKHRPLYITLIVPNVQGNRRATCGTEYVGRWQGKATVENGRRFRPGDFGWADGGVFEDIEIKDILYHAIYKDALTNRFEVIDYKDLQKLYLAKESVPE